MQEVIQESKTTTTTPSKKSRMNGLPIKAFFNACARNWYWFVISAIVCGSIAYLYSKSQTQVYQAGALIVINNKDSKTAGTTSQVFSDLNLAQGNGIVCNELYKLRSTAIMENVVEHLGLNIQYYGHVYLRDVNIYKKSPVQITPLKSEPGSFTMTIVPKSNTQFEFEVDGDGKWKKANFGSKVNTRHGPVAVTKTKLFTPQFKDYTVKVRVSSVAATARGFVSRLSAEQADKYSDIVRMTFTADNYDLCLDILNALIVAYNEDAINDKNTVARSTEQFIQKRIEEISNDLSDVDSRIASLKSASASATMYADASSGVRYQENVSDVNMQVSLASYIRDYLMRMQGNELIPSNTGISNTGIEAQISQYNEVMLKYQKIAATATGESPVIADLTRQLNAMKENIMRTLNNYINSLSIKQNQARSQEHLATGSITSLPSHEKAINEVTRSQTVKEQLYLYLLNKREENALQLAITEPNAKVIEHAGGSSSPIAPIPSRIIMMGLLIGLLIPALILYAIYWILSLDTKIHTRRDVESCCDVPIVGELPAKKESQKELEVIVSPDGRDRVTEAFRIIRSNVDFVVGNTKQDNKGCVVQFTSTMAGEGKSFIALNLALTYAHVDKRVVVVDLDLRKGRFSEYAGIEATHGAGVSAYLSKKIDDIHDVIVKGKIDKNLDFVPLGAIPPNPTGLLMSNRLDEMLRTLAQEYDYVFLDTVPFGLIADAALINRHVDLTVYVIRDGKVDKRILEDLEKMNAEDKIHNLTFLVNDIKLDKKNYGYGSYGYGYGYDFDYNYYSYDRSEEEEKPRRWWEFWKK